jgi:hypothetical protein
MWSPTKLDFLFYDFFKDPVKKNKKEKYKIIVTVAEPSSKPLGGYLTGFRKFGGRKSGYIV